MNSHKTEFSCPLVKCLQTILLYHSSTLIGDDSSGIRIQNNKAWYSFC